jgi:hypothetical protein
MALTVETGTGSATADCMWSLIQFKAYCTAVGYVVTAYTDEQMEAACRRGAIFLNTAFAWAGTKVNGRAQTQSWPREDVTDRDGEDVDPASVPSEIISAGCETSYYELVNPNGLSPAVNLSKQVKTTTVGPITKEYFQSSQDAENARPVLLIVQDMINGLLAAGSNGNTNLLLRV